MTFTSQKFIDTRTGEIVTQVPISEICSFNEYAGPLQAGDFDTTQAAKPEEAEAPAQDWDRGVSKADFGPEGML